MRSSYLKGNNLFCLLAILGILNDTNILSTIVEVISFGEKMYSRYYDYSDSTISMHL